MTREDKNLLVTDLCARLPYRVKCSFGVDDAVYEITGINPTCCGASAIQATHIKSSINGDFLLSSCKPYLFPLSSMTEEQKEELEDMNWSFDDSVINNIVEYLGYHRQFVTHFDCFALIDWLNKHHFDYRGLIEKGIAIEAPEGMYN